MLQPFRYFVYILACSVLFILLARHFDERSPKMTAQVFEWQKQVQVYFGSEKAGSLDDCTVVAPVSRTIVNAETLAPGALEKLLLGPTSGEKRVGYFSSINDGVLIQKFEVKGGVAYIDLSSRFSEGVAGSCRVMAIRSQIERTLTDLPDIDSVVISVNGETEGILEP